MEHKKQHYIPQTYLNSWCDPDAPEGYDGYVWVFDYDGKTSKKKSPKSLFYESDMYTIINDKGDRVLSIEHGLSGLESKFASIRDNKLDKHLDLSLEERYYILAFVAAINNRTPNIRDHISEQWGKVLELGKMMKKEYEAATPEGRKLMESIGPLSDNSLSYKLEDVEKFCENPLQTQMLPRINSEFICYTEMNMSILCTEDEIGFITSDDPCVWFDPEAYKRPPMYRSIGLGYKKVEVTMPISPKQTVIISHYPLPLYIPVQMKNVDSINRKTRFSANKYFVVNKNFKKDFWFKEIKPPDLDE